MTPTQVLAHLQRTFPDRLVLYAEDLAKVLGKSLRAVNRLLHQEDLPFKVKHLGEERCVDMFQVAEWLASDADLADDNLFLGCRPSLRLSVCRHFC